MANVSWAEFAELACAPVTVTVRGRVECTDPVAVEIVHFAPPDSWRIDDADHRPRYLANDRGHFTWPADGSGLACFQPRRDGHWHSGGMESPALIKPRDLLHPDGDFTGPLGPVEEVIHLGRRAWQVLLAPPPHKPAPIRQVVDVESGITLAYLSTDDAALLAFCAVAIGDDLPAGTFDDRWISHR